MKVKGGSKVRMEGDEIKLCISVCGYNIYRKLNYCYSWVSQCGVVEPSSRFIYLSLNIFG